VKSFLGKVKFFEEIHPESGREYKIYHLYAPKEK
jgi:hypothetical protein